jgi:hypothetical protein
MSSVYMVSDKNSINRHNPFVDTPPGARRAEFEYESFAQPHRGTGGYEVPEPEVSPACQYGVGGSDLRIGVPCDVQTPDNPGHKVRYICPIKYKRQR